MIDPEKLEYFMGNKDFSKEDFIELINPSMGKLEQLDRTNFLCVFDMGTIKKITGFKTSTTINVTINEAILETKKNNGRWVVYKYQ